MTCVGQSRAYELERLYRYHMIFAYWFARPAFKSRGITNLTRIYIVTTSDIMQNFATKSWTMEAELAQQVAALQQQLEEEHIARRVAAEAAQVEAEFRSAGTYYSTINQVWGIESVAYERQHFDALFRERCPTMYLTIDNPH